MKSLIATALLLSLFALPAEAQERDRFRRSTSQRIERLHQQRGDFGRRGSSITVERSDSTPRRGYDPRSLEYRGNVHRGSSRRGSASHIRQRDALRRDAILRRSPRQDAILGTPSRRDTIRIDSDRRDRIRRDSGHRDPFRRDSGRRGRSVFGLSNDRGVVIFDRDRTFIIQQRDRDEQRDLIRVDGDRLGAVRPGLIVPTPSVAVPRTQQEDPRRLHGETISPFSAQVYAKSSLAGYEGPSDVYPVITSFSPGQTVTAIQAAGGADGFQWYLVASESQSAWVRGDRLLVTAQ